MGVIPPGTALGPGDRERLEQLRKLMEGSVRQLQGIEQSLSARTARGTRRFYQARIAEALRVIDALWRRGAGGQPAGELATWAEGHLPSAYGAGVQRALADLLAQEAAGVVGDRRLHVRTVTALLDNFNAGVERALIVPLKENVVRAARVVLSQAGFAEDVATGIVGGLPRRETSALLRRRLVRTLSEVLPANAEPDLSRIQVGRRTMSADAWAESFARTETARASTSAARATCVANGILHVQITTHAHPPCICTPFEGRIYRIYEDRGDPRFDWVGTLPGGGCPMHPNCVHREAPAVLALLEERGDVAHRAQVPADFRGLDESELARRVRQHADELRRYSESRTGMLPQRFRLERAA